MKLASNKLIESDSSVFYLYGEDTDTLFETAEALLQKGDADAIRLRADVSELAQVECENRSQGLFGVSKCYALVRNAGSATAKQSDQLLQMVAEARPENRLIVCAPNIAWKKALHKKMLADHKLVQSEFHIPTPAAFQQWLAGEIKAQNLHVSDEALQMLGERLYGLRAAARQLIDRLKLYDDGHEENITIQVVGDLLGERSPEDIEAYCHAVAKRDSEALILLRRLICDQQVSETQIISWLGIRIQQLLMYCWYRAQRERNPLQKAKVFGAARKHLPGEAGYWKGKELSYAVKRITEAEKLIKGASIENNLVVLERMTIDLLSCETTI